MAAKFHDAEVARLLAGLALEEFLPYFIAHEIDMETLMELTEEELAKLGLNKLGKRKKLFSHLQHLKLSVPRMPPMRHAEVRTLDFADLKLERPFAVGRMGDVFEGRLRNHTNVVIRRLDSSKHINRPVFMNELKYLSLISNHPHVVAFMGVAEDVSKQLHLVYERVPDGTLRQYLRSRKLPLHVLVDLIKDVAAGLDHLHQQGIVHRNLNTGNLLLERLRSCNIVKVSDGGLLKALEAAGVSGKDCRPSVRWMSPESIMSQKFTTKSDAYSFGIVMWEILSEGRLPYEEFGEDDEERLGETILAGARLPRPANCTDEVWTLIESCWTVDPDSRPTLFDLGNKLADLDLGRELLDEDDSDYDTELPDSYDLSDEESSSATINTHDDFSDGSGSLTLLSPRTPRPRQANSGQFDQHLQQPHQQASGCGEAGDMSIYT